MVCHPIIRRPWYTYGCPTWYWPYNGWSFGYHGRHWSVWFGDIWPTAGYGDSVYVSYSSPTYQSYVYYNQPTTTVVQDYDDIDRLIDQLKYGDADTRKEAARALGNTGSARALYPLVYAVEYDEEPLVRYYAARALGELRLRDALPPLRRVAASDPEEVVRTEAADAVYRILNNY